MHTAMTDAGRDESVRTTLLAALRARGVRVGRQASVAVPIDLLADTCSRLRLGEPAPGLAGLLELLVDERQCQPCPHPRTRAVAQAARLVEQQARALAHAEQGTATWTAHLAFFRKALQDYGDAVAAETEAVL